MDQDAIRQYVSAKFAGVDIVIPTDGIPAGDTFFIYNPDHDLEPKHQLPFATIVTKDYGDFDAASNLNREGVWRLNIGVSRDTFRSLIPSDTNHDFTQLDTVIPHPIYASQSWLSVLNPSDRTFETLKPLLREAYERAVSRHPNPERRTLHASSNN